MTADQLQILITTGDINKIKDTLKSVAIVQDVEKLLNQYNIEGHDVLNDQVRRDKLINGDNERETVTVKVARIPLAYQKNIVTTATAFLGVPEFKATPNDDLETKYLETLNKILDDNKFDYKFKSCVKKTKSEKQCAILVYNEPLEANNDYWDDFPVNKKPSFRVKMKLVARSLGDELYPIFDNKGDMIAFGRAFTSSEKIDLAEVKTEYFELYTDTKFYFSQKVGKDAWETNEYPNLVGKIPVALYWQPFTDFDDVNDLIQRLETKISNHADSNDYFDSPIVKAKGNIEGFSNKGQQGKVLQMSDGADAEYLEMAYPPESMKLEMENLKTFIEIFSHTPDTSFQNLKNLGYFSNMAMKVMFMAAHIKASDSEEIFGEGSQRLINYLKHHLVKIAPEFTKARKLAIKPKFTYFLPKNDQEDVDTILKCIKGGILSTESGIKINPLVSDAVAEIEAIKAEQDANADKEIDKATKLAAINKPMTGGL